MDDQASMDTTDSTNTTKSNSSTHGFGDFIARNLGLGSAGVIFNIAAFVLLSLSPDIKWPLKISLLSLVISDIAFLSAMIAYGGINWTGSSGEPACQFISSTILCTACIMYCTTAQHALYNYIAIFYPVKFRVWVNVRLSVILNLGSWVFSIVVVLASVEMPHSSILPCIPVLGLRGKRIIPSGLMAVLASIFVITVNVRVLWEIRKRDRAVKNMEPLPTVHYRRGNCELPVVTQVAEYNSGHIARQQTGACTSLADHFTIANRDTNPSTSTTVCKGSSNDNNVGNERWPVATQNSIFPYPKDSRNAECDGPFPGNQGTVNQSHGQSGSNSFPSPVQSSSTSILLPHIRMTASTTQAAFKNAKLRKTTLTLVILSLWCCGLTLPFSIYFIWLAQFPNQEMAEYALAPAGVLGSSLIVVNSLSNPFLYAWRFINWPKVIKKCKCRR